MENGLWLLWFLSLMIVRSRLLLASGCWFVVFSVCCWLLFCLFVVRCALLVGCDCDCD